MLLSDLAPVPGSKKKKFRRGRGHGSGNGKTAGRGHKGQNARSGGGVRPGFEGGQMPLYRRLPKRGFKNFNKKIIFVFNLNILDKLFSDGDVVDFQALKSKGLINKLEDGIKILGYGDLTKKLVIKANYFSKSAKEKIENAGGKAEVI